MILPFAVQVQVFSLGQYLTADVINPCHILTRQAHNVGAVSAACLAVRRAAFLPFDESYAGGLGAMDWCLRMREAGYVHVYTPHARMLCEDRELLLLRRPDPGETERIRAAWPAAADPCYSPYLSVKGNFALSPERAGRVREQAR